MTKVKLKTYCSDDLMWSVGKLLCNDFSSSWNTDVFRRMSACSTPIEYRNVVWPSKGSLPAGIFKCQYQLESIFKRYRFRSDQYTDAELLDMSMKKFTDTQIRIGTPKELRTALTDPVIRRARSHAKAILGKYCEEEHLDRCKFGSKSSVGNPLASSYLDVKVAEGGPISGSKEHVAWFKRYADGAILKHLGDDFGPPCLSLPLVMVPKSFKSLRSIMPNTTLGGYYTYGLGVLLQEKLAAAGLDITRRQDKHRRWIKRYSIDLSHATADLSAASDSYRAELVNMLVPREWYNALKLGRIARYHTGPSEKVLTSMVSFMTMGIGFTFQLQTLLFYCLLCAIKDLLHLKGRVSVYGDDLIYPSRMHVHVVRVFSQLDFIFNSDKTYVHDSFRESCGSDCCRGVDVRPFQPMGATQELARLPYLSLLYKTANGLLLRWSKEEIPQTLRFLHLEMMRVTDALHIVPQHFPDGSGIKTPDPYTLISPFIEQHRVEFDRELWAFKFPFLQSKPRMRITTQHWMYLWDSLRRGATTPETVSDSVFRKLDHKWRRSHGLDRVKDAPVDVLVWRKHRKGRRVCVRYGMRWKEYVPSLVPFLPERSSPLRFEYQVGTSSSWSEASVI